MKNIVLGILGTMLLTTGLVAKNNMFIGAEVGYSSSDYEDDFSKNNSKSIYTSYKLGKYFDEYRLSMSLQNSSSIGINADYLFIQENSGFTPYIGAVIGYYYHESSYTNKSPSYEYTSKQSVITLGATLGLIYEINDSFEIDTGCGVGIHRGNDSMSGSAISCAIGINYLFRD